jgi:hypothetical protein
MRLRARSVAHLGAGPPPAARPLLPSLGAAGRRAPAASLLIRSMRTPRSARRRRPLSAFCSRRTMGQKVPASAADLPRSCRHRASLTRGERVAAGDRSACIRKSSVAKGKWFGRQFSVLRTP